MIDNKKNCVVAVGNSTEIECNTFLDATQKYQKALSTLSCQNQVLTTEHKTEIIFHETWEQCIEYIEKMVFLKTSVTPKTEVKELNKKIKRAILSQKRDPEENDMLEVEEGSIIWTPPTKIFVEKGKNVQLRFLIGSAQQQNITYKWYCLEQSGDNMNVIAYGHFLNIQLNEDSLVLLGEATKPDGTIVCTQEIEVSASKITSDQTLTELNALFNKDTSEFEYKYKCNLDNVATEIQEMKPYLLSIACFKKAAARPPPHLERHQAFLAIGYGNKFKQLETKLLAGDLFAPEIKAEVMNNVLLLFKGKDYGKAYDYL